MRLSSIAVLLCSLTLSRPATADDVSTPPSVFSHVAGGCAAGSQSACQCPNGAWSTQTCQLGGALSLCACGAASGVVDGLAGIDWNKPKPKKRKRRSSGVGMLIGGLITLGMGTTSLAIGITLIRDDTVVPLGVVLTATGGTAMAVGLPLSIVGLVRVAEGDDRGYYYGSHDGLSATGPRFEAMPGGFGLSF